jgi:hypothetical protein
MLVISNGYRVSIGRVFNELHQTIQCFADAVDSGETTRDNGEYCLSSLSLWGRGAILSITIVTIRWIAGRRRFAYRCPDKGW